MDRIPILAKLKGRQIGYVEGDEARDLLDRRRARYNEKTGLLLALDSGKTVGYVSLQGVFVGASWLADELFPIVDTNHPESRPKEDRRNDVDVTLADAISVAANDIAGQHNVATVFAVRGIGETPSLLSKRSEPAAGPLSSLEISREGSRLQKYSKDAGLSFADKNFEQRNVEAFQVISGTGEAPSASSEQRRPIANPLLNSSDTHQESPGVKAHLSDAGLQRISGRRNVDAFPVVRGIEGAPTLPSKQSEPKAQSLSSFEHTPPEASLLQENTKDNGVSFHSEISEKRDVETSQTIRRTGETPSASSEQRKAAAKPFLSPKITHQESLGVEVQLTDIGLPATGRISEQRNVETYPAARGIDATPSLPSKPGEPAAGPLSGLDSKDTGVSFHSEIFEKRDVEIFQAMRWTRKTPSPLYERRRGAAKEFLNAENTHEKSPGARASLSEAGLSAGRSISEQKTLETFPTVRGISRPPEPNELSMNLFSNSGTDGGQENNLAKGSSNEAGFSTVGEILERGDAEEVCEDRDFDDAPRLPPFEQTEAVDGLLSRFDDNTQQTTRGAERASSAPNFVTASGVFSRQRDVSVSSMSFEVADPDVHTNQLDEPSALDAATFFELDVDAAVGKFRSELGKCGGRERARRVITDETSNTDILFLPDAERAVRMALSELQKRILASAAAPVNVGAKETEPTDDFFSIDVERAVAMVRKALEKKS